MTDNPMQPVTDAEKRIGLSIEIELKVLTVPQRNELVRRLAKLVPMYGSSDTMIDQATADKTPRAANMPKGAKR